MVLVIAAKGGTASDADDGALGVGGKPMVDGGAAQVGGGDQVDLQGARPDGLPVGMGALAVFLKVDAGIVDQNVDLALPGEGSGPERPRGTGIAQLGLHQMAAVGAKLGRKGLCRAAAGAVVQHDRPARRHHGAHGGRPDAP
jgi:hypothetical protein